MSANIPDQMRIVPEDDGSPDGLCWIMGDEFSRLNKNIFWTGFCTTRKAAEARIVRLRAGDQVETAQLVRFA